MAVTAENQVTDTKRSDALGGEIPAGYKMTEVGVIPKDWEAIPFGLAATLRKTKIDTRITNEQIFCVELEHISKGTGVLEGNTYTARRSSIKSCFCKDDILFGKLRSYLRKYWLADRNGVASTEIWPIVANLSISIPKYIFYLVQTEEFIEAASLAYGTHMPRSDWNTLEKFKFPLPPKTQQRAIAAALSDIDSLITSLNALIAKKRNIKQAAMQQLLTGKSRLPGFQCQWKHTKLKDIGYFSKGKGIKKEEVLPSGIPCIRYGEIYTHHNDIIRQFYSFIPEIVAKESQRLKYGDLLFTLSGETANEIGKCVAFVSNVEAYAGGDIAIFSPIEQDSAFLGYLMNHFSITNQKIKMAQGDAVVHISARNLAAMEFYLPPKNEQIMISSILCDIDADIAALEQQLHKTQALKQGMMQQLLSGRIRIA